MSGYSGVSTVAATANVPGVKRGRVRLHKHAGYGGPYALAGCRQARPALPCCTAIENRDSMFDWSFAPPTPAYANVDLARFNGELQPRSRPAVLRGLVEHWPAVAKGRESDAALCGYLRGLDSGAPADACFGHAAMAGRFFYDDSLTAFNFERRSVTVSQLLDFLLQLKASPETLYGYAGAVRIKESLPAFLQENPSPLIDPAVDQLNSIWIGNQTRICAHWDLPQNLICAVAGRRRYLLFPPDQLANLYAGPIDFTPAGQPISMVDFAAPDFDRFPRFAEAIGHVEVAELEPGDALFLPSMWWHHAESLAPIGIMVNYWWRDVPAHVTTPRATLLHALLTLRDLPREQRLAWRAFFDHYIFRLDDDQPLAYLPAEARGVLGDMTPERAAALRAQLAQTLQW